jgi:hypothetical protein
MTSDLILRVIALCIALACAETLHGIARTMFLVPKIGKQRALRYSIISGSLLALTVCYFFVPGIGLSTFAQHLLLGIVLAIFMATFDLVMGMTLLHRSWKKAFEDFNPATGNLLIFGLGFLVFCPAIVGWLHGRY